MEHSLPSQEQFDIPFPTVGCVIMASGESRRFGSNKLLADFLGRPMIRQILDTTDRLTGERVVITRTPEVATLCHELGIEVIFHSLPGRGDAIRLGVEYLKNAGLSHLLFCPSDQPLLSRITLIELLEAGIRYPERIFRPCYGDAPGSPVLFPTWTFAELAALPSEKGGRALLEKYPGKVSLLSIPNEWELMDADTPEALDFLQKHAGCN